MAIEISCDDCGESYRVGDDRAGTRVRCKSCGGAIHVPDDSGDDDYDDGMYDERPKRSSRGSSKRRSKSSGVPMGAIIGGIGAVAVLGIGLIVFMMVGKGGNNAPVQIPNNAVAQNNNPLPAPVEPQQGANQTQPVGAVPAAAQGNAGQNNSRENAGQTARNPLPVKRGAPPPPPPPAAGSGNVAKTQTPPSSKGFAAGTGALGKGFAEGAESADGSMPGPAEWGVKIGALLPVTPVDPGKKVAIKFPQGSDLNAITFSDTPSAFVVLGGGFFFKGDREVWNMATGKRIGTIKIPTAAARRGDWALSPDGAYVAIPNDKTVGVWATKNGELLGEVNLEGAHFAKRIAAFAGNNRLLTANGNQMQVWELPEGSQQHQIEVKDITNRDFLAISPDGQYVAILNDHKSLQFWDLGTGALCGEVNLTKRVGFGRVDSLGMAFSRDGKRFAAVIREGHPNLVVMQLTDGSIERRIELKEIPHHSSIIHDSPGSHLDWFTNGQQLLWNGHHVLDAQVGGPVWSAPDESDSSRAPRSILDEKRIIIAIGQGNQNGELRTVPIPTEEIQAATNVVAAGGEASEAGMPPLTSADRTGMLVISDRNAAEWAMQPDPVAPEILIKKSYTLNETRSSLFDAFALRPDVGRCVLFFSNSHRSNSNSLASRIPVNNSNPKGLIEVIDVALSKSIMTVPLTYECEALSVSPEGGAVVIVPEGIRGRRVDVYSLIDGQPIAGWKPYQDVNDHSTTAAIAIDSEHVITMNKAGTCICWKLPECRAIYQINDVRLGSLSPSGYYLNLELNDKVLFLVAKTGDIVGELPTLSEDSAIGYSKNAEQIAVWSKEGNQQRLVIANTATGEITRDLFVAAGGPSVQWCDDRYLLLGNAVLYDLQQDAVAWRYTHSQRIDFRNPVDTMTVTGGNAQSQVWFLARNTNSNGPPALTGITLPEPKVRDIIDRAVLKDQTILEAGHNVKLAININSSPSNRPNFATDVAIAFQKNLQSQGYTISPDANSTISVSVSQMSTGKTTEYSGAGRIGRTSVAEIKVDYSVDVIQNGQTQWNFKGSSRNTLHFAFVKDNESIETSLNNGMWNNVYSNLAENFKLPKKVFASTSGKGLGESKFILGGTQPIRE